MTELVQERGGAPPARGWLNVALAGVAMITLAMIVVAMVLIDKPHFGWMVTQVFLPVITSGVILGGALSPSRRWCCRSGRAGAASR
jgi:peptidoglycan/LPS O-acetylase OafA/YrhL